MATALNSISLNRRYGMQKTMKSITQLLDYAATHPDTEIICYASNMILHVHLNGSYLCDPKGQIRAGGFYFLTSRMQDHNTIIPLNSNIAIKCMMLKHVLSLAAETEIRALFIRTSKATYTHTNR